MNTTEFYSKIKFHYFEISKDKNKSIFSAIIALILIGILDYATGPQFGFFVFYYLPILFAGWYMGRNYAILFSLLATLIWFYADSIAAQSYYSEFFRYWNSFIRLLSFSLVGILFSNFRINFDKEKEMNLKLTKALNEVKQLSGLMHICASCKNIRNDKGYWEQIEDYLKDHSDASFSHSICPSCMEKLYPKVVQKRKDKLSKNPD
ncbi:MAG: hypothetical protein JXR69_08185 [Candidatus Delongbacteria bacterium]|nr:hypothetical protein [Candidatus Delongbacteria bacterium]